MTTVELAFEEYGTENHEPLLILHGFFASSRNWRQMAKRLACHFHVYCLDLRNHGLSPHHSVMDYPTMVADILAFMAQQQLTSVNMMGHSMGGKVAMWFALSHPLRIRHLIIADISPVTYQHRFDLLIEALQSLPLAQISNRKQADDFLSSAIPELAYRQFLLQNLQLQNGHYEWRVDLSILKHQADNIVGFPENASLTNKETQSLLTNKVLFIMGGQSVYKNATAIYHYFPTAKIVTLPNANHWLHVDNPDGFYDEVMQFLT